MEADFHHRVFIAKSLPNGRCLSRDLQQCADSLKKVVYNAKYTWAGVVTENVECFTQLLGSILTTLLDSMHT